jgi:hypothetical protein
MKYRKKPVIIDAIQFTDDGSSCVYKLKEFMGQVHIKYPTPTSCALAIDTLEGIMTANQGDWIIKGVNGEFYPCKPDIFEKTYELVTEIYPPYTSTTT